MHNAVPIDVKIYEEARRMALESCRTLEEVINELLTEGLKLVAKRPERRQLGQLRGTIAIAVDFDDATPEGLDSLSDSN